MHYQKIFNRKLCVFVAISAACQALSVVLLYYLIPCQNVGYSPRFYSQVFIKCSPDLDRDYSVLAYYLNKICFIMACCGTAAVNFSTFCKIMFIRMSSNARFNNKDFKRDVRLFTLTSS
uniref:7TM_GPCR_Srx domain-containing protein n=1 Tax=Steinernema glaseri TaxID=37863 RepID=A0A1I8ARN9_9BILA